MILWNFINEIDTKKTFYQNLVVIDQVIDFRRRSVRRPFVVRVVVVVLDHLERKLRFFLKMILKVKIKIYLRLFIKTSQSRRVQAFFARVCEKFRSSSGLPDLQSKTVTKKNHENFTKI